MYTVTLTEMTHAVLFTQNYKTQRNAWKRYVALRSNLKRDQTVAYSLLNEEGTVLNTMTHRNGKETRSYMDTDGALTLV